MHAESVFCVLPTYLALSYKASEICKLSRKLPADFQELPLPAVTGLVVLSRFLQVGLEGFRQIGSFIVVFEQLIVCVQYI